MGAAAARCGGYRSRHIEREGQETRSPASAHCRRACSSTEALGSGQHVAPHTIIFSRILSRPHTSRHRRREGMLPRVRRQHGCMHTRELGHVLVRTCPWVCSLSRVLARAPAICACAVRIMHGECPAMFPRLDRCPRADRKSLRLAPAGQPCSPFKRPGGHLAPAPRR